jgi:hypothetical protein
MMQGGKMSRRRWLVVAVFTIAVTLAVGGGTAVLTSAAPAGPTAKPPGRQRLAQLLLDHCVAEDRPHRRWWLHCAGDTSRTTLDIEDSPVIPAEPLRCHIEMAVVGRMTVGGVHFQQTHP